MEPVGQPGSSEQPPTGAGAQSEGNGQPPPTKKGFRFWAILVGLGITNLLGALENTVVTTSAPTIVADLEIGENYIWITNAFFVCSMIIDIIVSDLVPLRERGKYMALVLAIYGIGTTMGPFIGGILTETIGWPWVFWINLPIGGAALVVLYLFLHVNYKKEMTVSQKLRRIDYVGNGILMAATVAVLYALTYAGTVYSWSSWNVLVPLILGLFGFFLFAAFEVWGFSAEPVMPPRIFATRTSVVIAINTFINSALVYWIIYFLPVYFQSVHLFSPSYTGVALLTQSLVGIPGAAISAIALSRWGKYKPIHFSGFALSTIGMGLFSLLREGSSTAAWVLFQCVAALGAGMILNVLLPSFQAPIEEADQAAATAAWCFIRTHGQVWGVAIPATIFNNQVDRLLYRISDLDVRERLAGGGAYQYASANFVSSFDEPLRGEVIGVYREALRLVFLVGIAFAGLAFLLVFIEKEIPLRTVLETEFGLAEAKTAEKDVEKSSDNADDSGVLTT
ncbi:hypothetical protein DL764_000393 [Monosporascus ibericus]|uniref:Major facilitator superfamily (MFS) profile domain-containing protein n=1 Tax=Monosporascus ibericus TaxID=155417 RepID=A0A4Q4TTR7_9PEZI|nr:hypothetical protein DL764_000393 [Monosporascus ibericus]